MLKELNVCIIAGGFGTRSANPEIPKSLQKINEKPLLFYQLNLLGNIKCKKKVYIIGHYKFEDIRNYVHEIEKKFKNMEIHLIQEKYATGTYGAYKNYLQKSNAKNTVILLGDIYFEIKIEQVYKFHMKNSSDLTIITHPTDHPDDSDIVAYDYITNKVTNFYKKNLKIKSGICGATGLFIVKNEWLKNLKTRSTDLTSTLCENALKKNREFFNYRTSAFIKDSGTLERQKIISKHLSNKEVIRSHALFLDLDDTLIRNCEVKNSRIPFVLNKKILLKIKEYNKKKIKVIICTNQPGIAKNYFSTGDLSKFLLKIEKLLEKYGAFVNDWFICPHHPEKGWKNENRKYKINCTCRKPKIGLFIKAAKKHDINLELSTYIGDMETDKKLAIKLNMKFYMFNEKNLSNYVNK